MTRIIATLVVFGILAFVGKSVLHGTTAVGKGVGKGAVAIVKVLV